MLTATAIDSGACDDRPPVSKMAAGESVTAPTDVLGETVSRTVAAAAPATAVAAAAAFAG